MKNHTFIYVDFHFCSIHQYTRTHNTHGRHGIEFETHLRQCATTTNRRYVSGKDESHCNVKKERTNEGKYFVLKISIF